MYFITIFHSIIYPKTLQYAHQTLGRLHLETEEGKLDSRQQNCNNDGSRASLWKKAETISLTSQMK